MCSCEDFFLACFRGEPRRPLSKTWFAGNPQNYKRADKGSGRQAVRENVCLCGKQMGRVLNYPVGIYLFVVQRFKADKENR